MSSQHLALIWLVLVAASGCQFHARSPEDYRKDTRALLETRSAQIQSCYDGLVKQDPAAAGTVAVRFTVAEDSGALIDIQVLGESTAPATVGECVVKALTGLALQPPDQRQGEATFVWEFKRS